MLFADVKVSVKVIVRISSFGILLRLTNFAILDGLLSSILFKIFIIAGNNFNQIKLKKMNNKTDKISIEVQINAAGQQQLSQYKNAFDGLRRSISDLSNPIPQLSNNINKLSDSIEQLGKDSNPVNTTLGKIKDASDNLTPTLKGLGAIFKLLKGEAIGLTSALTGGLTLLIAFLPELLNWVRELSKGDTTLSALNKTLKDTKIVIDAVNQVRLQGTKSAQQELVHLELLYNATRNKNISDAERKKILEELKAQYPGYFDKMTTEKMMNGQAAQSYNELTKSIIATSRARAAENVMVKNQERVIGNATNITRLKAELSDYNKQLTVAQKAYDSVKDRVIIGGSTFAPGLDSGKENAYRKLAEIKEKRDAQQKLINNLYTDSTLLNRQNDALAKTVADDTSKYGAKTLGVNPVISYQPSSGSETGNGRNKPPKEDRPISHDSPFENVKQDSSSITKSMEDEKQKSFEIQQNQILNHKIERIRTLEVEETESALRRARAEDELTKSKIHSGDKFIDAALKNSKKDSAIFKTAFLAKKATSIADTIINTKQAVMESLKAYAGIPFIGQALGIAQAVFMGVQGASSVAEIAKQKPGFAGGGRFVSDGKGALLSGYSRKDDTNAYLRSGEAVVVSEAMRNPWARNLVSAINVAHGGRDFSVANPSRGYAIGGIFTDGGNSNRYYNQPMNDQKDLANTIAYQMINNFPPVYVDVKDINSQQSILAQTVNRVNL
jgi:predicted  nucleic acid-binding Zn-ribbon protein